MLNAAATEKGEMFTPRILSRLLRREPPAATHAPQPNRTAVRPPDVFGQAEPVWKALWNWVRASKTPSEGNRRPQALDEARLDFANALADLPGEDALDLRRRGQSARSLRELWHLRADLYSMVARHRSQTEADRRVKLVNRHFPTSTKPTSSTASTRSGQRLDV